MANFSALTPGERRLLAALNRNHVRYMLVGLSAAVLQGANTATRDIDIWFADLGDPRIGRAVEQAKGIWTSGSFGMRPPQIGGDAIGDRIDVVVHLDGLQSFEKEVKNAVALEIDGIPVLVLSLDRILASKRAADRPKDRAVVPALEEALAVVKPRTRRKRKRRRK